MGDAQLEDIKRIGRSLASWYSEGPWRRGAHPFRLGLPRLNCNKWSGSLKESVRNAWTILYVAAVFRYQQVTMQQKMKAIDAAGRAKVCI